MRKISKRDAIALVNEFLKKELVKEDWYQRIQKHVKAIVLYGSVAKGMNRADSDIDIYLISPLKIEETYAAGDYFYYYKHREIDIVLRSIERLRKLAKGKHNNFEAEIFRGSEIISERDGEARELISKIRK